MLPKSHNYSPLNCEGETQEAKDTQFTQNSYMTLEKSKFLS